MILAYECTFIFANKMIYNIGHLEQTGEKKCSYLDEKYFFYNFSIQCKKMEFHGGHVYGIRKEHNFHYFVSRQNNVKCRFLKFRRYQNFANLFSKLSETTFLQRYK